MNIGAIPAAVSLVALGLLVVGVGTGLLLRLHPRTAPAGTRLARFSAASLYSGGTVVGSTIFSASAGVASMDDRMTARSKSFKNAS